MEVYWIKPAGPGLPHGAAFGLGVTAIDRDDALALLREKIGPCEIGSVRVIRSLDDLEENHVRKNMGNFLKRGIWYPIGSGW